MPHESTYATTPPPAEATFAAGSPYQELNAYIGQALIVNIISGHDFDRQPAELGGRLGLRTDTPGIPALFYVGQIIRTQQTGDEQLLYMSQDGELHQLDAGYGVPDEVANRAEWLWSRALDREAKDATRPTQRIHVDAERVNATDDAAPSGATAEAAGSRWQRVISLGKKVGSLLFGTARPQRPDRPGGRHRGNRPGSQRPQDTRPTSHRHGRHRTTSPAGHRPTQGRHRAATSTNRPTTGRHRP